MSQYFPPFRTFGENVKVELDLSSYATKTGLKSVTHVDVSSFELKSNLASLKTEVDKIDVDKLKTLPVDLNTLSNVVNNVVKKTVYGKLVTKVNNIDTTGFVLKAKYGTDKSNLEKKISSAEKNIRGTSRLVKETDLSFKVSEIETKIPIISSLVTYTALTAVENKIHDISSLVKNTDLNTKIREIESKVSDHDHDEYITTSEFNKLTKENFKARLAQAHLVTKTDFDAKLKILNKKN